MCKNVTEKLEEHLEFFKENYPNRKWLAIAANGSMNYNLMTEDSDVDSRILVFPTADEIIFNRFPISCTLAIDNTEQIDVKDVRLFFDILRKGNPNSFETLFTPYVITNNKDYYSQDWHEILSIREQIVNIDPSRTFNAAIGMAIQKQRAMKRLYEDTGKTDYKSLSHIMRLNYLIDYYSDYWNPNFDSYYNFMTLSDYRLEQVLNCKNGNFDERFAEDLSEYLINSMKNKKKTYISHNDNGVNVEAVNSLASVQERIVSKHIKAIIDKKWSSIYFNGEG